MTFRPSAAAQDRALQTIHAAQLFHDRARAIAYACSFASESHMIVVGLGADFTFDGISTVPRAEMASFIRELDGDGWQLAFPPRAGVEEVRDRALALARLSFARWEAFRRWESAHERPDV